MESINRDNLKNRLIQEGYKEANGIEQTINRLLALEGDAARMLNEWLNDGKRPEFAPIEGIDSTLLRNQLEMKEPAIILSYGMLLVNPTINSVYLKRLLNKHINYGLNK